MTFSEIRIGTKLSITLYNEEGEPSGTGLTSQFESLGRDGAVVILMPMKEGMFVPVLPDEILEVGFERGNTVYSFRAIARERTREGRLRFLHVLPETEIESIQRRDFYRFSHMMACSYRLLREPIPPEAERGPFRSTSTCNMSGGGLGLLFEDKPEMGMNIEGKLDIAGGVRFVGAIVRMEQLAAGSAYRYEAGVSFLKIENRERERIISYIYESQRNLLKKGWTGT